MKTFELGYWMNPDGAGSAELNLTSSFVEARLRDTNGSGEGDEESFGESTAGSIQFRINEGVIEYLDFDEEYDEVWTPLTEVQS